MKKKDSRINQIMELLALNGKVEVNELSATLGVSQVTIRKDLADMENLGIIKREHGFAVISSRDDINGRIAYHYEQKCKIAEKAALLVKDGETIMIESGSCCALMAEALAETKKNLSIITNSAFIADYIRKKSDFEIIMLGGTYQHDSQVMVGPMVRQCAKNFWVEKYFIGIDGYSDRTGFTNQDQMRAQAVRDMSEQAEKVIVLTESEKFLKHGTVPMNISENVKTIITDSKLTVEIKEKFSNKGIELILA